MRNLIILERDDDDKCVSGELNDHIVIGNLRRSDDTPFLCLSAERTPFAHAHYYLVKRTTEMERHLQNNVIFIGSSHPHVSLTSAITQLIRCVLALAAISQLLSQISHENLWWHLGFFRISYIFRSFYWFFFAGKIFRFLWQIDSGKIFWRKNDYRTTVIFGQTIREIRWVWCEISYYVQIDYFV